MGVLSGLCNEMDDVVNAESYRPGEPNARERDKEMKRHTSLGAQAVSGFTSTMSRGMTSMRRMPDMAGIHANEMESQYGEDCPQNN